jgi:cholesterol 7-desaturase
VRLWCGCALACACCVIRGLVVFTLSPHHNINNHYQHPKKKHLHFATPFGKVMLIETVTPVQPLLQRITHQVFAEWTVPRFFAKFIMGSTIVQFERDVPIWNNKTYLNNPGLVKEDGPIAKYRRWFAKNFYSENSEKVARDRAAATGSIDW